MSERIPPPPTQFYKFLVFLLYLAGVVMIVFKAVSMETSPLWPIVVLTVALFLTLVSMSTERGGDK